MNLTSLTTNFFCVCVCVWGVGGVGGVGGGSGGRHFQLTFLNAQVVKITLEVS